MREPYICQYCDQRSIRWWNLKIRMKRKHDEFSLDRSSGRYTPNNPFWDNNPYHKFGGTVAGSVGNANPITAAIAIALTAIVTLRK
jgi:hypothetical protein